MKKVLLVITSLFILFSCDSTTTENKSLTTYNWNWFSLDIPVSWVAIDGSWSALPTPRDGKLELVVSSKEQKDGFINNLLVLSKDLETDSNSYDFMVKNNPKNYKWYAEYAEVEAKDFVFNDWEKSKLYVFDAKYNKDNSKLKFLQTARICDGKKSFFLTMGLSLNITDTAKYEDIFKSFKCD